MKTTLTESELRALVVLLGDEDRRMHRIAREHLLAAGSRSFPYLTEGARTGDPLVRGRARLLLEEMRLTDLEERWSAYGGQPDAAMDLEEGCLLLAAFGTPDLDPATVTRDLDELAAALRERIPAAAPMEEQMEALCKFLGSELGYRAGTQNEHTDPDAVYVNRVLERRLGIQIALSVVYMLVGRRLGLPIQGVGLPGHFIVQAALPGGVMYIDPAGGGRIWSRQDCFNYLRSIGIGPVEAYLRPSTTRRTVARMLVNLVNAYTQLGDEKRAAQVHRFLDIVTGQE